MRRCYAFAGLPAPEMRWAANPGEIPALLHDTGDSVWNLVSASALTSVWNSVGGAYDGGPLWAAWPAVESYYREVCGLVLPGDLSERGRALADLRSSCGPTLLFERVCILLERPLSWEPLAWRTETPQGVAGPHDESHADEPRTPQEPNPCAREALGPIPRADLAEALDVDPNEDLVEVAWNLRRECDRLAQGRREMEELLDLARLYLRVERLGGMRGLRARIMGEVDHA